MEVDYERTSRHNYLILREMTEVEEESFSVQMVLRNQMKGLLVCTVRYLEGKQCFFYEITSRQSLSALLEQKKLSCQEIKAIFESLFEVIERVDEYLLGPEQLLLEPEYIYRDMNGEKYSFCFCPACSRNIFQQIRNLAEEMLPYIDHQDKQAVLLGYGLYRISMEDHVELGQMKAVLESYKNQPEEKNVLQEKEEVFDSVQEEEEEKRARILDEFFKEDETENESFLQKIIHKFFGKKKRKEEKEESIEADDFWENDAEVPAFIQEKQEKTEEEETVLLSSTKVHKNSSRIEKLKENGCVYNLEKEWILIGKAESCVDICIQEQTISRVHARIHHTQDGDSIMDMNSKNGTQINGKFLQPKEEYQLENGDEIIFSEEVFKYFTEN